MKKTLLVCMLLIAIVLSFAACGGKDNPPSNSGGNGNETPVHTHSFGEWETTKNPTCTKDGAKVRYCSCGEKQSEIVALLGHTPADAIIEDKVDATYEANGSYNEVVRCTTCGEKLSESSHIIPMLKHSPAEAVTENVIDATCYSEGSYDTVVYCSDCGVELERTKHTVEKVAHTPADAVEENIVDSTCYSVGSKDMVVYCSVPECHAFIEKSSVTIDKKAHAPAEAVVENIIEATCTTDGSYDEVVRCSTCKEKLSEKSHTVPMLKHTPAEVVMENLIHATCTENGSYDEVIYCSDEDCKTQISRTSKTIDALDHTYEFGTCIICGFIRYSSEGLKYSLNDDGESYTVVGIGSCTDTEVVIPSTFEGKPVTIIGHGAFVLSSHIISMYIPETVLEILCDEWYGNPFLMCSNLEKFEVDKANPAYRSIDGSLYTKDSKTLIKYASGRKNKDFVIPDSVVNVGIAAFQYSIYLENIIIPDNVVDLGKAAFGSCTNIKYVKIGSGVTNMNTPFLLCSNLLDVEISSDNKAFKSINGNIYSKDGTVLLQYALGKTETLFNIPNGVTIIGEHSFRGCENLINVIISNGVTTIDYYAFGGCTNLSSITIPKSLTKISESAFRDCTNLTSITIPENVIEIGESAFSKCTSLTSVYITSIESWLKISFSFGANPCTDGADLYLNGELLTQLIVPNSITSISEYAFSGCTSIKSVTIPNSVTSIEYGAFQNCTNLESVVLANGIARIRSFLFAGCTNLTSVVIPNSVTILDNNIFDNCNSLADIYYMGTEEEWSAININSFSNTIIENATIHYNYVPEE